MIFHFAFLQHNFPVHFLSISNPDVDDDDDYGGDDDDNNMENQGGRQGMHANLPW